MMNRFCRFPLSAMFFCMILLLACKNQAGPQEKLSGEPEPRTHTQPPLLPADPVSEDQLRQAAFEGEQSMVRELLGQGVNVNAMDAEGRTAIMFAAFNGHSEILRTLVNAGAVVDMRDAMGNTALMYASTGPFPESVLLLLEKGADPNAVDSDEHFTAVMHAASEGHLEVVKILIDHGADHTLKDIDGDDAASFARQNGHSQVVTYLQGLD
jgi:ankyrin repeat protein